MDGLIIGQISVVFVIDLIYFLPGQVRVNISFLLILIYNVPYDLWKPMDDDIESDL